MLYESSVPMIQELEQTAHLVFRDTWKDNGGFLRLSLGFCRA